LPPPPGGRVGASPREIRLRHGDSRGRWEGGTLVVGVANFTNKTECFGSRENPRLTERYTRVSEDRIPYRVIREDPTT
jgi:hypothetical protein